MIPLTAGHLGLPFQTLDIVAELRWFVYKNAVARVLNLDETAAQMCSVKWDIKDIRSEHSPYVDSIIAHTKVVGSRIDIMGE